MNCEGCNNTEARFLRIRFVPIKKAEDGAVLESEKVETCDKCYGVKPSYFRDAAGNKVHVPVGFSKFSYAIDTHITGTKQYSEHLKKNNLALKETI